MTFRLLLLQATRQGILIAGMRKIYWLWAIVAWLELCGTCLSTRAGVAPFTVDHFGAAQGLPASVVFCLLQTRDGYLWAGTQQGLARFDGVRFAVFDENNTPGLSNSEIGRLFEDSEDNLWISTVSGGTVLVDKTGKLTSLEGAAGHSKTPVMAICEDRSGDVWLYHSDGLLERYRQGKLLASRSVGMPDASNFRGLVEEESGVLLVGTDLTLHSLALKAPGGQNQVPPPSEPMFSRIHSILASKTGGFWLLANGRIQKYSKSGEVQYDWGPYPWLINSPTIAACEDRDGNLIIGTWNDGLYWFDAKGNATRLGVEQGEQGLSHNSILSLVVDRDGCLWVGTNGGGLNRVKRQILKVLDGTEGAVVQSLCEDGQGLWIGCNGNRIDFLTNGVISRFQLVPVSPIEAKTLPVPDVKSVFVTRNPNGPGGSRVLAGVWSAQGPHLFQFEQDQFKPVILPDDLNRNISAIFQDHSGRLWLGTEGGLLRYDDRKLFTTTNGLSANDVRAIAEDHDGTLWIGTQGGGFSRMRDSQFSSFTKADGLPSDFIRTLYVDAEGTLWVGTSGGLARFQNGRWQRFSTQDGLAFNSIAYLMEDTQGWFWLGSNLGLMHVKKQALNAFADGKATSIACRTYGKPDGLPSGECTFGSQPSALCRYDGTLWFPTIAGLASLDPARLNINTNPPPVVIESVTVGQLQSTNALRLPPPESVTVPAGKEDLEIQYTSLNLAAPDKCLFKYRLSRVGHPEIWSAAGNIRTVPYPKLAPGQYRFEVIACNEDGVWNEAGASLTVTILPAFWQTWWFIGVTTAGLLGMIVGGVHYVSTQKLQRQVERLRHQEALEKERARIARDIHDQVGASLTQVSLLGELVESDKDNPEEVESHARQISQTALETTRALDEIVWTVNPSNDTLDGLINYVCKYAQEYLAVAGLRYRIEVPAQLPAIPISPELRHNVFLAAKEAVTNIVRHARASSAWLRLNLEPRRFTLEIEDDGRGLTGQEGQSTRNGLRNMRKRMEDIGGQFDIGPGSEAGTRVRLTAPLSGQDS